MFEEPQSREAPFLVISKRRLNLKRSVKRFSTGDLDHLRSPERRDKCFGSEGVASIIHSPIALKRPILGCDDM